MCHCEAFLLSAAEDSTPGATEKAITQPHGGESRNADLSSKIEMATQKTLHCPICRKDVALDDPNVPFCSDRCRVIDLGKWASGEYKITSPILDPDVLADLDNAQLRKLNEDTGDDD